MIESLRDALSTGKGRRGAVSTLVLAILACPSTPCLGLVELIEGNAPLSHFNDAAWPGLAAVVNDPSRVLFAMGPVAQQTAFYQGDTAALQRVLRAFATVVMKERVVFLRPGRGDGWLSRNGATPYTWRLEVNQGDWRVPVAGEVSSPIRQGLPTVTVFAGGGVDLEELRIPEGITLVGVDELRERDRQGLLGDDASVRGAAVRQLAQIDPYGKESAAAVERLLGDETLRRVVETALAVFAERAADPPAERAAYEEDERRIRRVIFAWRYGWLKRAVVVAVAATGALLVATVVLGRARRAGRAEAP